MANYNKYNPELREKILRFYLEEGRTKKSLTEEYQFIQKYHETFGFRWLFCKFNLSPNAY